MKDGYSICFNQWALDKEIKNELNLLLIISSLCAEKGYCFASNKYLADLFEITETSISTKLKKLSDKGYIVITYKKRGCEIISREIRIKNILIDDLKIFNSTNKKYLKDNNINIKNTNNNNIYKEVKHFFGEYKRVRLSDKEYNKLVDDFGKDYLDQIINKLDEYIESNNNKNKYTNYNLVIRKAIRDKWFEKKTYKKENIEPSWLNKEIKEEELSDETRRMLEYVNGED